ncbi:MAG: DUF4446 family protein [Actinobacteria bacterium]|nr:MAG: DUF4446 family protein [Actinomycetota bacterium]
MLAPAVSRDTLSIISIAAAAVAVVALVLVLVLGRRVRRMRRALRGRPAAPRSEHGGRTEEPETLALELAGLREETIALQDAVALAVQRVGIVRFDAFEDLGGMLSFAVAMLDKEGSGVVLSSINGRNETRIYAKPVEHGGSRINLSGEEEEAIRRALGAVRR